MNCYIQAKQVQVFNICKERVMTQGDVRIPEEEFDKIVQLVNLGEDSFVLVKLAEQLPDGTPIGSVEIVPIPLGGGGCSQCDKRSCTQCNKCNLRQQ
jgi:hypothetical protein